MKAKIEKGVLSLRLADLVEELSDEEKRDIARLVCADEIIFGAVLECVAEGRFFSDDRDGEWWFSSERLLELREKLVPLLPDIWWEALREALRQRNEARAESERHRTWAYALYHAWPEDRWQDRPQGPAEWKPTWVPGESAVEAFAAEVAGKDEP